MDFMIINQSWQWEHEIPPYALELIERCGRACYKSEDKINNDSKMRFGRFIMDSGHHSVIEHVNATVRFITNRGVTHELVRHRLCAYSQESTRYVNYKNRGLEFIKPVWIEGDFPEAASKSSTAATFWNACKNASKTYETLLDQGWTPQQAREVLPNSLKTEILMTANLREWRHVFKMRTSNAAHPQMRALMRSCLAGFKASIQIIFDDIEVKE